MIGTFFCVKIKKKSEFDELSISYLKDQLTPDGEIEPANKKNGGSNSQSRDGLPPNMRFSRYAYIWLPVLDYDKKRNLNLEYGILN